jgi:CheY-like chemotaxis protein
MSKKILVVDNELPSRKLIAYFLREESYEVDEADDGASALELLERKEFDLMICDLVMPRLSAFDVIDRNEVPRTIDFNHPYNRSPLFACRKRVWKLTLSHEAL